MSGMSSLARLFVAVLLLAACDSSGSAGPTGPRIAGETCTEAGDCQTGLCVAVSATRNVCTLGCSEGGSECPLNPAWSCELPVEIDRRICICHADATVELCGDGLDNDCDGQTDDCQICNGRVVPFDDRVNCGTCGNVCPIGSTCSGGECECPAEGCVDAGNSNVECLEDGDCNDDIVCTQDICINQLCVRRVVPARCPAGEVCDLRMGGCIASRPCANSDDCEDEDPCTTDEICDPSTRVCIWLPLDGDHDNDPPRVCGGTDCDDDDPTTLLGAPELCDGVDNDCNGDIDAPLASDACSEDRACNLGRCECTAGTECGLAQCIDTLTDVQHCGACFAGCPATASCNSGTCDCPGAQIICRDSFLLDEQCVDSSSDSAHCGNCTTRCSASQTCVSGACADLDECLNGADNCDTNATCTNTNPGFTCTCNTNYVGNGVTCTPNECASGDDNCDANATCIDTTLGFTCQCNDGYTGNGVTCTDYNECTSYYEHSCVTTPAACVNTVGGFECVCPAGYTGSGQREDDYPCSDVNECAMNLDDCDANANCTNTTGSFTCACATGYTGNGRTCTALATLTNLTPSTGALSPAFLATTRSYALTVPLSVDSITFTPIAPAGTQVRINTELVLTSTASSPIPLALGMNTVNVTLTGNGLADSSYTIAVVRGTATYIKASNTGDADMFATQIAISGDTLVVGAPYEASASPGVNANQNDNSLYAAGAAYVFVRSNGVWTQQAYLKASNPLSYALFGNSVDVDGNTIVIGAPGTSTGTVYVFTRSGTTWTEQAIVTASNAAASDNFGASVAISANTIAVGAPFEDSNAVGIGGLETDNSATSAGAAYVFTRSGTVWTQQAYIKASNTGASDGFGNKVALDVNTLAVNALGEDSFATGVDGNQADNTASSSGAVYVFARAGTVWTQQAYVKASNTGASDAFGTSISINGNTLAIGAQNEDSYAAGSPSDNTATNSGALYVFSRSGVTWTEQALIKAPVIDASDLFGASVAVEGNVLIVGAIGEDSNATGINGNQNSNASTSSGAVYRYTRSGNAWTMDLYIKSSNTDPSDNFGFTVALGTNTFVIGTPYEDSNATGINGIQTNNNVTDAGAVYVY